MAISPQKLATLPTTEQYNADFMMQNPQYSYVPKAPPGSPEAAAKQQAEDMAKYFPTVLETGTKIDKTVPELSAKADAVRKEVKAKTVKAENDKKAEIANADTSYESVYSKAFNEITGNETLQSQFEEIPEEKSIREMKASNLDAQTNLALSVLQGQFAQKRELLKRQQEASTKGVTNVLNLAGSSRYAPISSQGLIDEKNRYDLQTLNDLDAEEQKLKTSILQAHTAGDFKLLEEQQAALDKKREEKIALANKITENVMAQNKEVRDRMYEGQKQLDKDLTSIKLSLAEAGAPQDIKDAVESATNVDEAISVAGDYLQKGTGDLGSYLYYKRESEKSGQSPLSYMDFLNKKTQIEKQAGLSGTSDVSFDQFSKEQIALSVIPTQLRNSDTELKRYLSGIRLGLQEGKTPFQIADELIGYKINNPDDFSTGMRQYIALANLSTQEIGNVARLINSGNKAGAISVVENKMMNEQKKLDPEGYVGESTARYYANKVEEIKKQIEDNGLMDAIGPLEGTAESISGRFKSGEAAKVMAKVTSLVAEMRNHLSGTAVTDSEKKFLEPLIASLYDKKGIFITKINEIKDNSLLRLNQVRKAAQLPELYEDQLIDRNKRAEIYSQSQIIGDQIISEQENQEKQLSNYIASHPEKQEEINSKIKEMEDALGRSIDTSEFYQMYPQYK